MSESYDSLNASTKSVRRPTVYWTKEETVRMHEFVAQNRVMLLGSILSLLKANRKTNRRNFFTGMEAYVGTKNASQCKSKYQKQEILLLKEVGVPAHIIQQYILYLRNKRVQKVHLRKAKEVSIKEKVETSKNSITVEELKPQIVCVEQLKKRLAEEYMPRIKNEAMKHHFYEMIQRLPEVQPLPIQVRRINLAIGFDLPIKENLEFKVTITQNKTSIENVNK